MIGVFDSGLGGLTVVRALRKLLPSETLLYLGDTARVPYGNKSKETVARYADEALRFLKTVASELNTRRTHEAEHSSQAPSSVPWPLPLKMVVIACNTVTAVALPLLRQRIDVPVIGVIRPAVQRAIQVTQTRSVAVIGTEGTIRSRSYQHTLEEVDPGMEILAIPCPLLAPLVEEGWLSHPVTDLTLQIYLAPLRDHKSDTLILGCTHYPLLRPAIQTCVGERYTLVDSADTTALDAHALLQKRGWLAPSSAKGELLCFVTDSAERFRTFADRFLGEAPQSVEQVDLSRYTLGVKG